MTHLMETIGGVTDSRTDEEKIAEALARPSTSGHAHQGAGSTAGQLARMADLMRITASASTPRRSKSNAACSSCAT